MIEELKLFIEESFTNTISEILKYDRKNVT